LILSIIMGSWRKKGREMILTCVDPVFPKYVVVPTGE